MPIQLMSEVCFSSVLVPLLLYTKNNDKKGFEWEISSDCMVRLSYHENLTSFAWTTARC